MQIALKTDKAGLTGRKCPNNSCGKHFKIKAGTGLPGVSCSCLYCGTKGSASELMTEDQRKLIMSHAQREVADIIQRTFSGLSQSSFGSSMSFKVANNSSPAIHYYEELQLEQYVTCGNCTLEYEIYGVFGYCPDCRQHNS